MTSKLTREQTQQIIDAADAVITALAGTNDEVHKDDTDKMVRLWDDLNDRYAPPEVVRELARMVLGAMDSEPVAWKYEEYVYVSGLGHLWREKLDCEFPGIECGTLRGVVPLYRHAQQPVVPATLPCSVELKPGLIIGMGCKTETLLTALRRRADYNADIDAMTPEERAEHDASIKAFKAMLAAAPQPQNAPQNIPEIIPGWIPVSERMPETYVNVLLTDEHDDVCIGQLEFEGDIYFYVVGSTHRHKATHWMLLPNPPKEVKS